MTIDEFFDKIREYPHKWNTGEFDLITSDEDLCPICTLALDMKGQRYLNSDYLNAAKLLGMNPLDAKHIGWAATGVAFPETRDRLISVLQDQNIVI